MRCEDYGSLSKVLVDLDCSIPSSHGVPNANPKKHTQWVHVPNNWVPVIWVIVIAVQVLGTYMIVRYLDP